MDEPRQSRSDIGDVGIVSLDEETLQTPVAFQNPPKPGKKKGYVVSPEKSVHEIQIGGLKTPKVGFDYEATGRWSHSVQDLTHGFSHEVDPANGEAGSGKSRDLLVTRIPV